MKIYDCSNSEYRPEHRGGGGPVTNEIMRYLHENAETYGHSFVGAEESEVIITNDVFPPGLSGKKVKRMGGVFEGELERNNKYNKAAQEADVVIFISEYVRETYDKLYGLETIKDSVVINNWVDPIIYKPKIKYADVPVKFAAIATDWKRKEKRLESIIEFANIFKWLEITLIGKCELELPKNMRAVGYIEEPEKVAEVLREQDGFINFSYRDAGPKVVMQGISSGLPVLYSNSGGVPEVANYFGVEITENITEEGLIKGTIKYLNKYKELVNTVKLCNSGKKFKEMLRDYYFVISGI